MHRKKWIWLVAIVIVLVIFGLDRSGFLNRHAIFLYSKKHVPALTQELRKTTTFPSSLAVYISAPALSQEHVQQLRTKIISELGITEVPSSKETVMFMALIQGRRVINTLTYYPGEGIQPTHLSKISDISLWETLGILMEK